jgi:type I restriction enzyme S subunit
MQRYESYKPSGIPWVGDIPSHWGVKKNKFLLSERKAVVGKDAPNFKLLSLALQGVILRDMENPKGKFPAEFDTYKQVSPDDLIFCLFDVEETPRTVGLAKHHGMITGAYTVTRCNEQVSSAFLYYYYLSLDEGKQLRSLYTGLRNVITRDTFFSLATPFPPREEQDRIVAFLDQKTAEIDAAIAKKERLIELLEEQAAILISNAVTKGLNADVPQRDSGVAWIGHIPSHWYVKRAKFLFREIDERSANGEEERLSVSHMTGVTPRSEKTNVYMFMAEDYSGSKLCRPNDLVFNIMWAWMGALGVSDRVGIVSPSYGVYRQLKEGTFNNWYLEHLLRSTLYVAEYNKRSTGLHSSRLRLYSHMFFDMELGFPPREEQDEIERETKKQVSQANAVITSVRSEIEKLAELRSSLVASVVTGKMRV